MDEEGGGGGNDSLCTNYGHALMKRQVHNFTTVQSYTEALTNRKTQVALFKHLSIVLAPNRSSSSILKLGLSEQLV